MKKLLYLAGILILVVLGWLALQKSAASLSPSGRLLLQVCQQQSCESAATVTVLTAPYKGFVASCALEPEVASKLKAAESIDWAFNETTLKFADAEIDLRYDCAAAERLPSPSGEKTLVVHKNCLFAPDELQVCRRSLTLEKRSKDGTQDLSFDCQYPLNQFDWDAVSAGDLTWNAVEDDLIWPLKPDSQFARASGDSVAKLSVQILCGNEAVIR